MSDQIFIHDLTLEMSVGIYDHEKEKKQRVIINIIIDVDTRTAPQSINDVVSYEDITNEVKALTEKKHFDLLEELAEEISDICLEKDKAIKVTVKLEKPDIIEQTKSVGIMIKRAK